VSPMVLKLGLRARMSSQTWHGINSSSGLCVAALALVVFGPAAEEGASLISELVVPGFIRLSMYSHECRGYGTNL
jgi:hypothetical protein